MKKCCCISCLVTILLIIALIAVVLFVITPDLIGIADTPIEFLGKKSFRDLGLEKLTVFQLIQEISKLLSPVNDANFVKYTPEDLQNAKTSLNLPQKEDGTVDYSDVFDKGLNQGTEPVSLTGNQTAAILNDLLKNYDKSSSGSASGSESGAQSGGQSGSANSSLDGISDSLTLSEISVSTNSSNENVMKMTFGVKVDDMLASTGGSLPEGMRNLLPGDTVYITQEYVIEEDEEGNLKLKEGQEYSDMLLNGNQSQVINALVGSLGSGEEDGNMLEEMQTKMGESVVHLLNQLGADSLTPGDATSESGYFTFVPKA